MSIRVDIKRTDYYNELPKERQDEYFDLTGQKFLPAIDNIYYGVFVRGDHKQNVKFQSLLETLEEFKQVAVETRQSSGAIR